jgi:hypothetical protein
MLRRPIAITVLSWIYIVVGVAGLAVHGRESFRSPHSEDIWVLVLELLAVVAGVFMLRGHNWARWLTVIWIGFHVVISVLNGYQQVLFHGIIFIGIAILLFRADARAWFGRTERRAV